MNAGITILVFALFFLWLFAEAKVISYKRKIDAYEHNYVILRDLYNNQMKANDEKDKEINRLIEKLYNANQDNRNGYEKLAKELKRLEEMLNEPK
mgnify:CR=1 FL=1